MARKCAVMVLLFFWCVGYGKLYAVDTLENAIEKEANYIVSNTPDGAVLAVVGIKSGSSLLSEYITERLPDYIIENTKNITLVDRSNLDLIQQELDFQYSGEVSDETMVSIGKKIGAQVIATGAITEAVRVYNFNVKILHVETAAILGSQTIQIVHDEVMDGFMGNSQVAQLIMAQAQQKREQREAAITTTKNVLGIFSDGTYFGYVGSLKLPIGISWGRLSGGASLFLDTGFGPPAFAGYDRSSHDGKMVYTDENKSTAFLWDLIVGLNINIIKTILWVDIGGGVQYRQDYHLYTEKSANRTTWVESDSDDHWKGVVSAGLLVKLWYFYIQGKYKYVIKEEFDSATYGLNHVSLGAGLVIRR